MSNHNSPQRITDEPETLDEAHEAQRVSALPPALQTLAVAHHQDQFDAIPSYLEQQAVNFAAFCATLGIQSE